MIDIPQNPSQSRDSQSFEQNVAQHAKKAAESTPPAEAVRRFEQACQEQDTPDTPDMSDTPETKDAPDMAQGTQTTAAMASMTGMIDNAYSAQGQQHFARAHETVAHEASMTVERKKTATHSPERDNAHTPLGMTHPLDGLFSPAPAPVAETSALPTDDAVSAVWGELAERILVAQTPQGGQEVRISVGQDILPGTEISLTRHPDGGLTAVLITNNASTLQTLVEGREDLRQRLENMGEGNVQVDVRTSTDGDGGDMRQRSRGLVYPDPEVEA